MRDCLRRGKHSIRSVSIVNAEAEKETRYLTFQIFTYGPNPSLGGWIGINAAIAADDPNLL
jgi:hypothetical protein